MEERTLKILGKERTILNKDGERGLLCIFKKSAFPTIYFTVYFSYCLYFVACTRPQRSVSTMCSMRCWKLWQMSRKLSMDCRLLPNSSTWTRYSWVSIILHSLTLYSPPSSQTGTDPGTGLLHICCCCCYETFFYSCFKDVY